jgi:hypothetical protein
MNFWSSSFLINIWATKNLVIEKFQLLLGNFLSPNWVIESFQLLTQKNKSIITWKKFCRRLEMFSCLTNNGSISTIDQTIKIFDHCPMFFSHCP